MSNIGIRNVAAKIMIEICNNCDSSFKFNSLDISHISDEKLVFKAVKYLVEKRYISVNSVGTSVLTGTLASSGIDWVEDYLETHSGI